MSIGVIILKGKAEVLGKKPVPVPVYSPQISSGLAGNKAGVPR